MKQRVLITGGAGFIGSNLVRHMLAKGWQVLNVDCLTYAGSLQSLDDVQGNADYQFSKTDIRDARPFQQVLVDFRPHAVMHLAAESHVDRSIDGPSAFIETNVIGSFNVLQASLEYWRFAPVEVRDRFRLLHVSTDEVYGSLGDDGLFNEQSRYEPHSPYSASKAASDHLARAWYCTYGLPVIVSHCSNNYGPFQHPEKLIPVVLLACLRNEPIPIFGTGENVRDWLFVEDHCAALSLMIEQGKVGETYNVGGDREMTNIELVRLLCSILDEYRPRVDGKSYQSLIAFVEDRPGHDLRYAVDASKLKRELGWRPLQIADQGFRDTVRWYLDNEDWWVHVKHAYARHFNASNI
jgi:dTDP-glucose 4,6-dehydratase